MLKQKIWPKKSLTPLTPIALNDRPWLGVPPALTGFSQLPARLFLETSQPRPQQMLEGAKSMKSGQFSTAPNAASWKNEIKDTHYGIWQRETGSEERVTRSWEREAGSGEGETGICNNVEKI